MSISNTEKLEGWVVVLNDEKAGERPLYLTNEHTFSPNIDDAKFWPAEEVPPGGPPITSQQNQRALVQIKALRAATFTRESRLL